MDQKSEVNVSGNLDQKHHHWAQQGYFMWQGTHISSDWVVRGHLKPIASAQAAARFKSLACTTEKNNVMSHPILSQ